MARREVGQVGAARSGLLVNFADDLLELMVLHGLSESEASIRSADFAAVICPRIERERRDKAICDMIPMERSVVRAAERFGIHRSTVYRTLARKSRKS